MPMGAGAAVSEAAAPRQIHLSRFDVLGWQSFADAQALARLRATSPAFAATSRPHLAAALAAEVVSIRQEGDLKALPSLLGALGRVAGRGDAAATAAALLRGVDGVPEVRRAARAALKRLAGRGDAGTLRALVPYLKDSRERIRAAALMALGQLGGRGDTAAIAKAASCLEDPVLSVRMAAVDSLRRLCDRGSGARAAAEAALARLSHGEAEVREAALICIEQLVEKGDEPVIAMVSARLESREPGICKAMIVALHQISDVGNPNVISKLASCLDGSPAEVRAVAVAAIGDIARKGDASAFSSVASQLENEDPAVRKVSVTSIEKIAARGDEKAAGLCVARLRDEEPGVRAAALLALGRIVSAVAANSVGTQVAACLGDDDPRVREAAAEVLGQLAGKEAGSALGGAGGSIAAAGRVLAEGGDLDRAAAVTALECIGRRGGVNPEPALSKLTQHLDRGEACCNVRAKAVATLGRLAERGDATVATAVAAHLADVSPEVRAAALEALGRLTVGVSAAASIAEAAHRDFEHPEVCAAGVAALSRLASEQAGHGGPTFAWVELIAASAGRLRSEDPITRRRALAKLQRAVADQSGCVSAPCGAPPYSRGGAQHGPGHVRRMSAS